MFVLWRVHAEEGRRSISCSTGWVVACMWVVAPALAALVGLSRQLLQHWLACPTPLTACPGPAQPALPGGRGACMQSPEAHGCCNVRVLVQVMQIYQMDAMNFRFMGHPSAWVVHRPHAPSSGYNHTFTGEAYTQVPSGPACPPSHLLMRAPDSAHGQP